MLSIEGLTVHYGGLAALTDVSMKVRVGEFVAILGPNGAGKSTLFKAISGAVPIVAGRITFEGRDLAMVPPAKRPHLGIAHVPEYRQVFSGMTVRENLELGTTPTRAGTSKARNIDYVLELFPVLRERANQPAGTLSGGEQQMLAIGRGLVSSPKLLLLDEPSMGLAPALVDQIFERIQYIHKSANLTLVLVEQRAVDALHLCDRAYVLSTGRIVMDGAGGELLGDEKVNRAYFGG
jgi:branched-chain amino acid transport system ATP-binding protein